MQMEGKTQIADFLTEMQEYSILLPSPSLKAHHKQADQSIIQADLNDIHTNWNDIQSKRSDIWAHWSVDLH